MRKLLVASLALMSLGAALVAVNPVPAHAQTPPPPSGCEQSSFFGLPRWNKYLDHRQTFGATDDCTVAIQNINDIWKVALALVEILSRLAGYIAVAFIIYGGFNLIISQGDPGRIQSGRNLILYSAVGLLIAVAATAAINLLGGTF